MNTSLDQTRLVTKFLFGPTNFIFLNNENFDAKSQNRSNPSKILLDLNSWQTMQFMVDYARIQGENTNKG